MSSPDRPIATHLTESQLGLEATDGRLGFLAGILRQVSDAVVAIDNDMRVTYLNPAAEELYGVEPGTGVGQPISELYTLGRQRPEDEASAYAALETNGEWRGENEHITRAGRRLIVESSVSLLRDAKGARTGLLAIIRDVTNRRTADEELRQSEDRFRRLFENAPIGIAISGPGGRYEQGNEAFTSLLGYSEEELRHKDLGELLHPDDRAENQAAVRRLIGGETQYFEIENRYLRKDGEPVWVHKFVCRLPIIGRRPSLVALVTDVSERRRTEQALRESQERLQHALEVKDDFLGLVSHELRTPLTPILGMSRALNRGLTREADVREAATVLSENAERLLGLVENMLILARLDRENADVAFEPVHLARMVRNVVERHEASYPNRVLHVHEPDIAPLVDGHPGWLEQVVQNLVGNAEKYAGPHAVVTVDLSLSDESASVRVIDNGLGLTDEQAQHVFEPFYRDPATANRTPGAGLGLAVCKRLVELQGGAIWARRGEDGGAEFGFSLPRLTAD
jgi:two-component system CheB/CheR fusion protein